jgi:hypothetical protein
MYAIKRRRPLTFLRLELLLGLALLVLRGGFSSPSELESRASMGGGGATVSNGVSSAMPSGLGRNTAGRMKAPRNNNEITRNVMVETNAKISGKRVTRPLRKKVIKL